MDIEPAVFTATERAEAELRRHRQQPRDFAVEADGQWPTLHAAFETISHDGGAGAGHAVYFVPEGWTENLDAIEATLAGLSADDLQTFAIGEEREAAAIAARDPALAQAHELLNAFFEDWPEIMPSADSIARGGWAEAEVQIKGMIAASEAALRAFDTGPFYGPAGPACRACGCTEGAACADPFTGWPCAWATPDLCTACVGIVQRVFAPAELTFLLHAAGGGALNLTRPSATALSAEGVLALRETLKVLAPNKEAADD